MKINIYLLFLSRVFQCCIGNPSGRITNVQDAELGQFPHQVRWAYYSNISQCGGNNYCNTFCGGSIYNKSTIITSARCCKPFDWDGHNLEDTGIITGTTSIYDIVNSQEKSIKNT